MSRGGAIHSSWVRTIPKAETTSSLNADGKRLLGEEFFVGTFARDTLPNKHMLWQHSNKLDLWGLIANTKDHDHPGEHWVAFLGHVPSGHVCMFDTYGRSPAELGFEHWFKSIRRSRQSTLYFNKRRVQDNKTSVCGLHCLHWLWHMKEASASSSHSCALTEYKRPALLRDSEVLKWAVKRGVDPFN